MGCSRNSCNIEGRTTPLSAPQLEVTGVPLGRRMHGRVHQNFDAFDVFPATTASSTMALSRNLSRSLKPQDDESDDDQHMDEVEGSSPSVLETGDGGEILSEGDEEDQEDEDHDHEAGSEEEDDAQQKLTSISFGTLAKAQAALPKIDKSNSRKRKLGAELSEEQEDKLQTLRKRLQELKDAKKGAPGGTVVNKPQDAKSRLARMSYHYADQRNKEVAKEDQDTGDDDSDSGPEETAHASRRKKRSAPESMPSNRAVTRRRTVLPNSSHKSRDPRFSNHGEEPDEDILSKRYSFLSDYRATEMAELRRAMKNSRDPSAKDALKQRLLSMEDQERTQQRRMAAKEVLRDHKKAEKEAVLQGKKPYFMKAGDVKREVMKRGFEKMGNKGKDRAIERRQKKVDQREKRRMPMERRSFEA